VKEDRHPITLYKAFNVPIVISTDDAGVLRTSMVEQYVLLAKRYKEIKYADIKKFVYNSIQYSFIKEPSLKQKLLSQLDKDFIRFEKSIPTFIYKNKKLLQTSKR
jgi:adenosine deaminase